MNTMQRTRNHPISLALALVGALATGVAFADAPIPPADFSFDVTQGNHSLFGCMPHAGLNGGTCGSETSGPGFAATSGGIGTPSYLPVTPDGTVLGTGTAVDALSDWKSGASVRSVATLNYFFEASGPSNVDFIPIDVLSRGLVAASGNATSYISLSVWDAGGDANIPPGVPDPDPKGPLLDLTAKCSHGVCTSSWGSGMELTDGLCVVNGDNYEIKISAITTARGSAHSAPDSASALLDPVIKLDPPYPKTCPVSVPISALSLRTGPGASTGVAAPEPSTLSLAGIAALGFVCMTRLRRRRQPLALRRTA
jgi:hypothetical protein